MGHKPTSFQTNKLSLIMPLLQEVWLLYLILYIHKHHPSHLMFNILYALLVQWNIKSYSKTKEATAKDFWEGKKKVLTVIKRCTESVT
jgi:hypothetical protein